MKPETSTFIDETYPEMVACYCETPDGWDANILLMLKELHEFQDKVPGGVCVRVQDLKEKFGQLRVSLSFDFGDPEDSNRITTSVWQVYSNRAYDVVKAHEILIECMCVNCGSIEKLDSQGGPYMYRLCPSCIISRK